MMFAQKKWDTLKVPKHRNMFEILKQKTIFKDIKDEIQKHTWQFDP